MAAFKARSRRGSDRAKYPPSVLQAGARYAADLMDPQAPEGDPLDGVLLGGATYRAQLAEQLVVQGGATWRGDLVNQSLLRGGATYRGDLATGGGPVQFDYMRTLVVAAQPDLAPGVLAAPVVRNLKLAGAWLKTYPTGRLRSAQAHDLIVEGFGGAQLAHEIEQYDATGGTMRINVRQGSYDPGAGNAILRLRYGSALQTTATQLPAQVWSHATAAWFPDGFDAVASRNLTQTNVVTTNLLPTSGLNCGTYTASSSGKIVNPSWISNIGALTLEIRIKPDSLAAEGLVFRVGKAAATGTPASDHALLVHFMPAVTPTGGSPRTHTLRIRAGWSVGGTRVVNAFYPPSGSVTDLEQLWHIVLQPGQVAKFYKDGIELTDVAAENAAASAGGALAVNSTDELTWGAAAGFGTGGSNGLAMKLGRAVIYPRALPAGEVAYINRLTWGANEVVGVSAEDARTDIDRGAVAVPLRQAATVNTDYTIDLAARAYDPNNDSVTLTAVGPATKGTATLAAGKLAYRPTAAGIDFVPFTVRDAQTAKTSSSFAVMVNAAAGGDAGDFADHGGPLITLTVDSVDYRVPAFMKGFEKDTSWTGTGVRFRCPKSKRQFRFGQFNNSNLQAYNGCAPAFHGANLIGYGLTNPSPDRTAKLTNSWSRIAGGPKDPTGTPPVYSSPNTGTKFFPNCLQGHPNLGEFRSDSNPGTMAVGIYMTTLPFEEATTTDVQNAYSTSDTVVDDWYKAFFSRLKDQSALYSNPVIIIRPNWEGMNQDTGLKLSNITQTRGGVRYSGNQWYEAGFTQTEYNAMMRKFCRIGKSHGPPNLYIVFSPAFETTKSGAMGLSYESYLTDTDGQGPGTTAWVGYTGTCASCHPDMRPGRAGSFNAAKGLIDGTGLSANNRYWTQRAIDMTLKYKIPFFSLEIGPSVPYTTAAWHDGSTKYYGDTFATLGPIANDPDNYGLIGAFGFLDNGGVLFPPTANATQGANCPGFWDNDDIADMLRCSKILRKYWGRKDLYNNAAIPAYADRTD